MPTKEQGFQYLKNPNRIIKYVLPLALSLHWIRKMTSDRSLLSRAVPTTLVVAPLCIMGLLSVTVLLPALKNPESKGYFSGIGYPALQRLAGKPIQVQTVPVKLKTLGDDVAAPGESIALQQVDVLPLVSGPVEKVFVLEGDRVRQGQPLVQLQRAPFEDEVNTARNNLKIAESNLQALQSSAPKTLAELNTNVESARARLTTANTKLKQINSLAESELKNNIESAKVRLATAETKLKQIRFLAEQGAIAKFQLYDIQDVYATRKRELLAAQQGALNTKSEVYKNQDFYITRQDDLSSNQIKLARVQSDLDQEIASARLNLQNKRIALQNALRDLNRTVISATTDGLVSLVNIHSGEIADTGNRNPLLTLTQNIVFKAYIDQIRLNAIKVGDQATVRLVAYPGRTFQGRVIRLNPTVETDAKKASKVGVDRQYTYSVWVAVDGLQMPPGLQGYVQFERGNTSLVIPESAVTHLSGGEGMVMVAKSGRAVIKQVKLGRKFDNQREVIEGLKPGEQVVPSPRALKPGDHLEMQSTQG